MAGVVVPNFAKLVSARPVSDNLPIGAFNAGAISNSLGDIATLYSANKQKQDSLFSVADAIAPSDPSTAAIIKGTADSINLFSPKQSNPLQEIAPLLQLAQSKQQHDASLGLQQQELSERKLVDQSNIQHRDMMDAKIAAQLNAPLPSLGQVGSVTVSGTQTPAYHETGLSYDGSDNPTVEGGVLPQLPGSPVSKTIPPQADPKAMMNGAIDLYDKSVSTFKQAYKKTPDEVLASDDPNEPGYKDADQIVQMQGKIEQLYGSTEKTKANPVASPAAPKDPWSWDNIPEGGMATKVLAPDLAVRRRKSAGNMIEQDVEIKNGKQYVGPDRVIKPMNKDGQQFVEPVDLPDGSQLSHVVFSDGKTHDIITRKPKNANELDIQQGVAPDGTVFNKVSWGEHTVIQASTEIKSLKSGIRELSKVRDDEAGIKKKMIDADPEELSILKKQFVSKVAYEKSLEGGIRELDPENKILPDNANGSPAWAKRNAESALDSFFGTNPTERKVERAAADIVSGLFGKSPSSNSAPSPAYVPTGQSQQSLSDRLNALSKGLKK